MPEPDNWPTRSRRYVGFWARVGAALIDSVLLVMIILPLIYWIYGPRYFVEPGMMAGAG